MAANRNEWVYDQLLGFLGSPLFQLPILTYMENRCIIFEPGTDDSSEYRDTHKEYRQLVESLLEGFLKDIDLSHDLLLKALGDLNTQEELRDIFQPIFEQILAMDDFKIFVHLMIQKNIELQQQALLLIAQQFGGVPVIFQTGLTTDMASPPTAESEEEAILRAVLEQSQREFEAMKKNKEKEKEQLDKILLTSKVEASKLEENRVREQEKMNQAISSLSLESQNYSRKASTASRKTSYSKPPFAASPVPSGRKISLSKQPADTQTSSAPQSISTVRNTGVTSSGVSGSEAAANWLKSALSDIDSSSGGASKNADALEDLSAKQLRERQEYLRQQRDKLIEMKKREREKQLKKAEADSRQRPSSARVARKALSGQPISASKTTNAEDEKKMAMRKAIAERLKAEVIDHQ